MSETQGGTLELERTAPAPVTSHGDGDHERFAHYYNRRQYDATEAAVFGTPIVALCGKKWVPSRDPSRFPVCPTCKAIYDASDPGDGPDDAM